MKNVTILDTETQGLDPAVDQAIEVAAILYSVEHATVLAAYSTLLHAEGNPCEAINRIPAAALRTAPGRADGPWAPVFDFAGRSDAILAHNADFDRGFVPSELRDAKPWICTQRDIEWPRHAKANPSLVAVALEHDLGVAAAHRALADCDLIARLLTRARELGADLDAMLARGLRPKGDFIALVSFEEKDKAKAAGFTWNPAARQWQRRMAIEDAAALPFRTRQQLGGEG